MERFVVMKQQMEHTQLPFLLADQHRGPVSQVELRDETPCGFGPLRAWLIWGW